MPYVRETSTSVSVEVDGKQVRVRLPKALIPPLHTGGADGWWLLENASVTDCKISGRFRINVLNKPVVVISRLNGEITVSGFGSTNFHGVCAKIDPAQRAF